MTDKLGNLALLIDGDNVSPKVITGLMSEIANYGTASVRRIYGDWTQPDLGGWKKCLLDNSILPVHAFAYTNHKNSTDIAMVIDAMDLLYTNRFSAFCLVSSDSDFTRLAARIREQGVTVYGFGERKTSTAFIAACTEFVYFDAFNVPSGEAEIVASEPQVPQTSPSKDPFNAFNPPRTPKAFQLPLRTIPQKKPLDQAALDGLAKAIKNSNSYDQEWVNLADVGDYLRRISPDLTARNYGYDRLKPFVEASGIASIRVKTLGNHPPIALVRLKENTGDDNV